MIGIVDELVGRELELERLDRFVAGIAERPCSLLLQGEAGIGKTVLIEHALLEARARGYEVVSAKPTSAERSLSFLGLTDLLSESHELLRELPLPQRRALEAALLLEEPGEATPDARAIALGVLGVLRSLAAPRPVLVSIDDLQWLDDPSAAALVFALRRLKSEPVGVLAAIRKDAESAASEITLAMRGESVEIGPLSIGAIYALLTERLQLSVPRALLLRVYEACRGIPLFALEIGRALKERGLPEPGQPFEIPADAETLFTARLEQLSEKTLDALAVAASIASPTRLLVRAVSSGALGPAIAADIIRIEGERIRFSHPLLASAAYARLSGAGRRRLHRRIATAVGDQEERARHLARAANAPDPEVAAALDEAAEHAARRGAPAAAAELAQLAVKLTPTEDAGRLGTRRRVAAELHFLAGDTARSRRMLERLVDELPAGPERARALLLLGEPRSGDLRVKMALYERAVGEAAGDDRVLAEALHLSARVLFVSGNVEPSLRRAREALAAAERTGDVRLLTASLSVAAWLEMWNGHITPGVLERALALEPDAGYLRFYESPSTVEGLRLMVLEDDLDGARARLLAAEAIAGDHGDDECRTLLLAQLAPLECRAGRLGSAERCATESYDLRQQFGLGPGAHLYLLALVKAHQGRSEQAQAAAESARTLCEEAGNEIFTVRSLWVLGLVALSSGDHSKAARILAPLPERLARSGYGRMNMLEVLPDAIEALIGVGNLDRAGAQLEELDAIARLGSARARAQAARCRGLLGAAERNHAAALAAFDEAVTAHGRLPDPIERGRTFLALGQTQRRAGRRRAARGALAQALTIFEEVGAALWAEQARTELERLGGRASSAGALTGAEQRVAHLVAEGRTNREVAAALFVTERTVETHLTSIYRKLDVRSRTELAGRLAARTS
ncbi:MAG TPA: AAA family ATPase [Gaiellaceae bacterium]|nr:AAA family ATPase [Gaiellaceae bacterium]